MHGPSKEAIDRQIVRFEQFLMQSGRSFMRKCILQFWQEKKAHWYFQV
jgi:hypothetical protein